MPTSLITGGAGFIGSHLVQELIIMNHKVIVLDDLSGGLERNIPREARFINGSITDHQLLTNIFSDNKIDYIYHLAAYAAEGLSHYIKSYNYQNNVVGSVNLINKAVKHNVKCFVFTSSIAVYGNQVSPMTEQMVPIPEDSYGIAKYTVEQELRISKEMFDLDYIIFRPHNVYGEHQNISDKYRNVVGIFMNQLLNGEPLSIFGDGDQTRAFSYVKDIAPIIARSTENAEIYGEVFNIGSDHAVSVKDLAGLVMKAMEMNEAIKYLEQRNEVKHAYASHEKIKKYLSHIESTKLEQGLKKMAEWAKKTSHQPTIKMKHLEITKNLPSFWK